MKRIFFTLIVACSTALVALPLKHSSSAEEISNQAIIQQKGKCRHRGFPGPRGPCEHRGNSVLSGDSEVSTAYGSFFTEQNIDIDAGDPIPFTSTSFSNKNVTLKPNGVIQLTQTGDYLVLFGASSQTGSNARIALTLNGSIIPGTNVTLPPTGSDLSNQFTTVAKTVRVSTAPARLQVINNDAMPLHIMIFLSTDISAFITVEKLHNLSTP